MYNTDHAHFRNYPTQKMCCECALEWVRRVNRLPNTPDMPGRRHGLHLLFVDICSLARAKTYKPLP